MVDSAHVRRSRREGRINLCRRASWTGWLGDRPPAQSRRVHEHPGCDPTAARSARSSGCERLVPVEPARIRLSSRGHRRRNPGQQHASRGVHLRQSDDPRHGCRGEPAQWRQASALPRELVHLPARLSSTDSRGVSPERPPRSDQRALRHRQDLRYSVVPGISAPVPDAISYRRCRRISTGPGTTSI